ncbi:MAG TPA: DUF488 domain-containing protein [Xanthobacteraceae bacterium]|jgi:uncharacterized protein (DUF488 family)|nr:DUF488 domain-containing protein [Xanthobacteraceae bacterium]
MLFSIGHSNHTIEHFISLLAGAGVKLLADVRSYPKSRYAPQFNREALEQSLPRSGIGYLWLGKELGGMARGRISPEAFEHGLGRLIAESGKQPAAMMCAERDPLDCHRWLWLTRELTARGIEVRHILANGKIERQAETEERLLAAEGLAGEDFFPREQRLADAYRARAAHRITAAE